VQESLFAYFGVRVGSWKKKEHEDGKEQPYVFKSHLMYQPMRATKVAAVEKRVVQT